MRRTGVTRITGQRLRHTAHRIRQTFAVFDNPVQLLSAAATGRVLRRRHDLVFRVNGVAMIARRHVVPSFRSTRCSRRTAIG